MFWLRNKENNFQLHTTYLTVDTCLTADPGVASPISGQSHTLAEIDHEIISTAILLPSADSRRVVVSYKQKYVNEVLVNCFITLAQEKSGQVN